MNAAATAPDWRSGALCAQTDPEAFFPAKGGTTRPAKRICQGCQVRAECLAYALAEDIRYGVWGGLSPNERRAIAARTTTAASAATWLAEQATEGSAAA